MNRAIIRVFHPHFGARMVLRTDDDWNRDLEPHGVVDVPGGMRSDFEILSAKSYVEHKPCLVGSGQFRWAEGSNRLALLVDDTPQDLYPSFYSGMHGRLTERIDIYAPALGRHVTIRVYLPPGYDENHLKRYPVLYAHDGANLFLPEEAFMGTEWRLDETVGQLDAMSVIDRVLVVGIHAGDRMRDYTDAGYAEYGRTVVDDVRGFVNQHFRTLTDPKHTFVMGSSLGGVVSLHLAWERPDVFGGAACMSSTFGYRDELFRRVTTDPVDSRRGLRLYLDSGWPRDNYEVTFSMAAALIDRGLAVTHFAFPLERHSETAWGSRVHLPLQLFLGKLNRWRGR